MSPLVSVILPVYNGAKYLEKALNSILDQTMPDFELIIVNDASTDESHTILEKFAQQDTRICLYINEINLGLPRTLNRCLELACGEYIARMDQDDISLPERLEKQVKFMQTHLDIDICGSWAKIIGNHEGEVWSYPCEHDEIYAKMLFNNYLIHPSVMMRTLAFRQHELFYDSSATRLEDYDLWSRALPLVRFANIPEPLLYYRLHGANTGDLHGDKQREERALIYERFLHRLGVEYTQEDIILHERISSKKFMADLPFLKQVREWLERIESANEKNRLIPSDALKTELGARWTQVCHFSRAYSLLICFEILNSRLRFYNKVGFLKVLSCVKYSLGRLMSVSSR